MYRYDVRRQSAMLILDLVDAFAAAERPGGPPPRPIGGLEFALIEPPTAPGGPATESAIEPVLRRNASGYHLFFGTVWRAEGGDRVRRRLAPAAGDYTLRLASDLYRPHDEVVNFGSRDPRRPLTIMLQPGQAYPFPRVQALNPRVAEASGCAAPDIPPRTGPTILRGTLRGREGAPITGAEVFVIGRAGTRAVTDDHGEWLLVFPDGAGITTGNVGVRIRRPDLAQTFDVPNVCLARGYDASLNQTSLAGRVVDADGRGIAGASVNVSSHPGTTTTDAEGAWAYCFDPGTPPQGTASVLVRARLNGITRTRTVPLAHRRRTVVPDFRFA